MGATLTITTGYGFAVPNRIIDARREDDEDFDIWDFIEDSYPLLDVDMANFRDYYPDEEDDVAYAVFIKSSIERHYGVGVFAASGSQAMYLRASKIERDEFNAMHTAAEALGVVAPETGWYTAVSYG